MGRGEELVRAWLDYTATHPYGCQAKGVVRHMMETHNYL